MEPNALRSARLPRRQEGAALFVSLIMLVIMTILGLSSVQTTSMEERMARNARDTNLALQSAESAIIDGIRIIDAMTTVDAVFLAPGANANGLYVNAGPTLTQNWMAVDWGGAAVRTAETDIAGVAASPKYIIEYVAESASEDAGVNLVNFGQDTGGARAQIFRITTYGTGGTATAHVMIQATYGRQMSR